MANVSGGTLTAVLSSCTVLPDGSAQIGLRYTAPSGRVLTRGINVPADRAKPILDEGGRVVTAAVPVGLGGAIDAFITQLEGMITAGASAGKLDL